MDIKFECDCGQRISVAEHSTGQEITCPNCQNQLIVPACVTVKAEPKKVRPTIRSCSLEQILFQENGILISTTRFVVINQTFALAGVVSVQPKEVPPKRKLALVVLLLGLPLLFVYIGIVFVLAALYVLFFQKSTYAVVLTTASGQCAAYNHPSKQVVERIVAILNQAIVAQG